ncbi:MAG TPA: hypothetical protein P5081_03515 [Phycisphaerae bacterium]|nr:hypothetical protein [Phycisphaerae bacterium]
MIAIGFLATLAAFDAVVRTNDASLSIYEMDRIERKLRTVESRIDPPDILILGSSRTAYGMAPSEFERATGLRAFNLGIPASKVVEWRFIARKALARTQPRLIVLGVNASGVREDNAPTYAAYSLFGARDFVDHTLENGWSNEMASNYFEGRLSRAWGAFGRGLELKFWLQERLVAVFPKHAQLARERREMVAESCTPDGYEHPWLFNERMRNLQQQIDEDGDAFVQKGSIPVFEPGGASMRAFNRLLDDLRATGIPLVVCYLPNSPRTTSRWRDVEPAMKAAIADACSRRRVRFVDGTAASPDRRNADYLDESHAGLGLARRISGFVASEIVATGLLDADGPVFASGREEGALGP